MSDIMNEPITTVAGLPDTKRAAALSKAFESAFGTPPSYIARAPGRVSIIGEHIDYAGLSVLPAAIDRDILCACAVEAPSSSGTSTIRLRNINPRFTDQEISYATGKDGPVLDQEAHGWENYFKAGLKGVLGHLKEEDANKAISLSIMISGNVPPAGGLSSSAAMVVSSAIATLQAYDAIKYTTQGQLAEVAITSERLVGVNSGGMDQSASIFSRKNHVLNVGFVPKLIATLVPFPERTPGIAYVIANTLITSEKQVTAKYHYNLRVVEMRVAAKLLQTWLRLDVAAELPTPKLVMDAYFAHSATYSASSNFLVERQRTLSIMLGIVEERFGNNQDGNSWSEVYEMLGGISQEQFKQTFHPDFEIEADRLKLYMRIKHAYSEARRVYQYRKLLEEAKDDDDSLARKLGDLMNESQASCRDLYECSCPEIEEVCELARKAGSFGSRVSGAGWGGCTVHLVAEENVENLIQTLQSEYYARRFPKVQGEALEAALFATRPKEGACLYTL